eukprot:TRINITY_DN56837_c0_g1_i2.p2 TRINITY_DN56837_c0_g1~~TRINITY_DN56837_c0_g1_i2.p2  ORF type:complete len:385 (-),score=161.00 TRINITY_DN56837_c0_g1_i2:39-1193(-)
MVWWVRTDPCGLFSAGLTSLLLIYAQFVFVWVVVLPWYGLSWHVVLYTALSALAFVSHCRAQFSEPGVVPLERKEARTTPHALKRSEEVIKQRRIHPRDLPKRCKHCHVIRPAEAHHCRLCGRCVMRMDHHCPWVNNCVGLFNQKYFLLFLIYTGLCCIYCGVMLVARFVSCTRSLRQCTVRGGHVALCVINFVEALVFGLFVAVMLFDQLQAIFENTPGIDALQNRRGVQRSKMENLTAVFGEKLSWTWLMPFNMPQSLSKELDRELDNAACLFTVAQQRRKVLAKQRADKELARAEAMEAAILKRAESGGNGALDDDDEAMRMHEEQLDSFYSESEDRIKRRQLNRDETEFDSEEEEDVDGYLSDEYEYYDDDYDDGRRHLD